MVDYRPMTNVPRHSLLAQIVEEAAATTGMKMKLIHGPMPHTRLDNDDYDPSRLQHLDHIASASGGDHGPFWREYDRFLKANGLREAMKR